MKRCFCALATTISVAILAGAGLTATAGTVWEQPGGAGSTGDFYQAGSNMDYLMADDFSLGNSTHLSLLTFWGHAAVNDPGYWDFAASGESGKSSGFLDSVTINIHSNTSGNLPGGIIQTELVSMSLVGAVIDHPDNYGTFGWKYTIDLAGTNHDFNLGAGDYWLSIFGNSSDTSKGWGWQSTDQGQVNNNSSYKFVNSNWVSFNVDFAFRLEGPESIPLPMPLLLGGVGLLVMIPLRRRLMMMHA